MTSENTNSAVVHNSKCTPVHLRYTPAELEMQRVDCEAMLLELAQHRDANEPKSNPNAATVPDFRLAYKSAPAKVFARSPPNADVDNDVNDDSCARRQRQLAMDNYRSHMMQVHYPDAPRKKAIGPYVRMVPTFRMLDEWGYTVSQVVNLEREVEQQMARDGFPVLWEEKFARSKVLADEHRRRCDAELKVKAADEAAINSERKRKFDAESAIKAISK